MGKTSKRCQLETESVTFNVLNPRENAMYVHVNKQTNKSGYMKHLIELDMMGALTFQPVMFDEIHVSEKCSVVKSESELLDSWMDD